MEETIRRVEEALSEMSGFNLYRLPMRGDFVEFVEYRDLFRMCGKRFTIKVELLIKKDGRVEYMMSEGHASAMKKRELARVLSKEEAQENWRIEKICEDIDSAIDGMMESLHASFGLQFEKLLPDVEIIDRTYHY